MKHRMKYKKIKITSIDPRIKKDRGLWGDGCYGASCMDECCIWGCDVDLATIELIEEHRDLIEPLTGAGIDTCFKTPLKEDEDYIGGSYRETRVRAEDGLCAFHLTGGTRGCALFTVWAKHNLPKFIVPTICRVYPVTWHRGELFKDSPIRPSCKVKEKTPKGSPAPSLFETQEKEIRELFDIECED